MNIGDVVVKIKADLRNFTAGMSKATEGIRAFSTRTTSIMASATRAIANFALRAGQQLVRFATVQVRRAILGMTALSVAIVKLGADAEESENLFEVAFEGMTDSVRDWSEQLAHALRISAHGVRENAGNFQLFLTGMEIGADKAAQLSKGLTELAYDMSSLRNMKFDVTMEKIRAALAGEVEPLRRVGITVNKTTLELWAMKNGLDANYDAWTEQQKVIARAGVIFDGAQKDMGDMARTAGSVTNLLRSLWDQFRELAVEIYQRWQPRLAEALQSMRDWLYENRQAIADWVGDVTDGLMRIVDFLRADWAQGLSGSLQVLAKIANAIMNAVIIIFEEGFKWIGRNIPGWIIGGLEGIVTNISKNINLGVLTKAWSETGKKIGAAFSEGFGRGMLRLTTILSSPGIEMTKQLLKTPEGDNIRQRLMPVLEDLAVELQKITDATIEAGKAAQDAGEAGQQAAEKQLTTVTQLESELPNLTKAFEEAGQEAAAAGQKAASTWERIWKEAGSSIAGSMSSAFADIIEDASSATEAISGMLSSIQRAISQAVFNQTLLPSIFGGLNAVGIPLQVPGQAPVFQGGQFAGPGNMARGGIVGLRYARQGMFTPKGTDTVPAMLTPGEAVIDADTTQRLQNILGASGNREAAQPSRTVNFNVTALDASSVVQLFRRHGRELAGVVMAERSPNHPIRRT